MVCILPFRCVFVGHRQQIDIIWIETKHMVNTCLNVDRFLFLWVASQTQANAQVIQPILYVYT